MGNGLVAYGSALGLTLAVEVPVVAAVFHSTRWRMAKIAAVVTTATHWSMHFVLPLLVESRATWLVAGEIGALVLEGAAYALLARPRDLGRGLLASALANGASF